jgi:peptide chain release factor 1
MPESAAPTPASLFRVPENVLLKLDDLSKQHAEISAMLEDPAVVTDHRRVRDLSVKRAALDPVVDSYREFRRVSRDAADLDAATKPGGDPDLAAMAFEELPVLRERGERLVREMTSRLVTSDDNKVGSVILEIRAGTGGDEACLWAADLLGMYQKYASARGWQFEVLDAVTEGIAGGVRGATVSVRGVGVWSELAFEAGVHSVKRVPATETQGRIHTSTATVAVLPEAEEVDVKVDWAADVEESATRSQGPGGQNVNKVESAWQIHHKASGIIIKMMEAKSQQQNKERARRLLVTRLAELERQRQHADRSAARKTQIRGGERSDKIRTYRWKEGIVADERLPGEYRLHEMIAGDLSKIMKDLVEQETSKRLAEL